MINVNSALLEQIVSLLEEHNIRCRSSEAPRCASLTFYGISRDSDEEMAIELIKLHFGASALLGAL